MGRSSFKVIIQKKTSNLGLEYMYMAFQLESYVWQDSTIIGLYYNKHEKCRIWKRLHNRRGS
jgi:hypothetical protein